MAEEIATATWQEPGCRKYSFVRSDSSPTRFLITEVWETQAHLNAHFETEHFKRLVPLMDAISETVSFDLCKDALTVKRERLGRILVLYDSASKCTESMAEYVAEGASLVDSMEVRIRVVPGEPNSWEKEGRKATKHQEATFDDLLWADGVACGTPCNLGCISWRMKKFWDDFSQAGYWSVVDGKLGCAFSSQGGHGGGAELVCMAMCTVMMNCGFSCFGITDYVSFMNTMHYGACCAKAPRNDEDKMICRREGTRLAEFVGLYILHRDDLHPMKNSKAADIKRWGYPGIPPKNAPMEELLELNTRKIDPVGDFVQMAEAKK